MGPHLALIRACWQWTSRHRDVPNFYDASSNGEQIEEVETVKHHSRKAIFFRSMSEEEVVLICTLFFPECRSLKLLQESPGTTRPMEELSLQRLSVSAVVFCV